MAAMFLVIHFSALPPAASNNVGSHELEEHCTENTNSGKTVMLPLLHVTVQKTPFKASSTEAAPLSNNYVITVAVSCSIKSAHSGAMSKHFWSWDETFWGPLPDFDNGSFSL